MKPAQPGLWLGEIFCFEMASHLCCNKKELTFDLLPQASLFHCLRAHHKRLRKILPIPRSLDMVSLNLHLSGSFPYVFFSSFFPACHMQLCSPTPHQAGSPDTGELNIVGTHSVCWHPVWGDDTALGRYFLWLIKERKVKVSLSWAEPWKNHDGAC